MRTLSCRPCETTVATTLAPATKGAPDDQLGAASDRQHLVERDLLADVGSEPLDLDLFAGGNPVLLAAGLDDRVHLDSFA